MGQPATWIAANGNVWTFLRNERTVGIEGFSPENQVAMWYVDRICQVRRPDGTVYYDYEMIDCGRHYGEV